MIYGKAFGKISVRSYSRRPGIGPLVILAILAAISGWVLLGGSRQVRGPAASQSSLRKPTGSAQLISYEPLSTEVDGKEMCQWESGTHGALTLVALQGEVPSSEREQAMRSAGSATSAGFS